MSSAQTTKTTAVPAWLAPVRMFASTTLGIVLIGLLVAYLAAASLWPAALGRAIGERPADVYSHWLMLVLAGTLLANILAATLLRLPMRASHVGAWVCHAGVMVLACGAWWYAARSLAGTAVTFAGAGGAWTPVDGFYSDKFFAVYVTAADGTVHQTPLGRLRGSGYRPLSAKLAGAPAGSQATVTGFMGQAKLTSAWDDLSPRANPAAEILVQAEGQDARFILCPAYEDTDSGSLGDVAITYQDNVTQAEVDDLIANAPKARAAHDLLFFITGPDHGPLLVGVSRGGQVWQSPAEMGKTVTGELSDQPVSATVVRMLAHARRTFRATPGGPEDPPAVEVKLAGPAALTTWLPLTEMGMHSPSMAIDLPDNRQMALAFSRQYLPLPAAVVVNKTQYETFPGSVVPKDYRCEVTVNEKPPRRETIALNQPLRMGDYQLSQSSWQPDAHNPRQIAFGVATRPGLVAVWTGGAMIIAGMLIAFYCRRWLSGRPA